MFHTVPTHTEGFADEPTLSCHSRETSHPQAFMPGQEITKQVNYFRSAVRDLLSMSKRLLISTIKKRPLTLPKTKKI